MFIAKKGRVTRALLGAFFLCAVPKTECSALRPPRSTDESLPKLTEIVLFKIIASKLAQNIPDSVIKKVDANANPQEIRDTLKQVIIAGTDIFELALQIESGELTNEFKEKLTNIRREFKLLNAHLVAESKKIKELKERLKKASTEERVRILQEETNVMLDMFNNMSGPMHTISVAFKDLNGMLISQLVQLLELIPPIKPYLTIEDGKDKITMSRFISVKLQEMIKYTEALKKIGINLKNTYEALREDILKCKNDLQKSYQAMSAQQKPLSQITLDVK